VGQGQRPAAGPLTCDDRATATVGLDRLQKGLMKKRLLYLSLSVSAVAALVFVAAAYAAYTKPSLSVSYTPGSTRIVATADVIEDATARAAIIVPVGTAVNTTAAPGTKVGTVQAQVSALALGGALLPLAGDIVVAPPGAVPPASQTACIGAVPPSATYLLVLSAAGQTINLPAYITPTAGAQIALGTTQLVFCLAPPDIPVDQGGATFGAKFLSADLTFTGVFAPLPVGAWISFWTPYQAGNGQVNAAGTVASVSLVAPGAVTLKGRRVNGRVTLTGKVSQLGDGFAERIQIWGAGKTGALKPLKTLISKDDGTYALTLARSAKQVRFQARVNSPLYTVTGTDAAGICKEVFTNNELGVPCSSWAISAFVANSKTVTVK
jgi:hypothetical protein